MPRFKTGDHVKIEITHPASGQSEWMWLLVERCDDKAQVVFGKLDNEPIVNTDMWVGQELAVAFDKIRDHRAF
jgi:uncharacterized protein YegJ (DUF2314 family)